MIRIIFEVLCACAASASFGIAFQLRGKKLLAASITGAIGWLAYLICDLFGFSAISCSFFATLVIAAISEYLARHIMLPPPFFWPFPSSPSYREADSTIPWNTA